MNRKGLIHFANIDQLCDSGELLMFGVFEQEELEGTISLQRRGHICNYYVRRSCQGKGAGRLLFDYAKRYCKEELHKTIMTVDAAPEAVKKYADDTWKMLCAYGNGNSLVE